MKIIKIKWNVKGFKTAYGKVFIADEETGSTYEKEFLFDSKINNNNIYNINNINYKLINNGGLFTPQLELIKM